MNNNNANFTPAAPNFRTLVRMSFQGLTNFPYIEEDFDALTNYELLSKVVEYLNQVISNNNEQNTLMTNLYNAYVSLQNYVNDYFDNLDVQDEINNKLDDMAQSGELTLLIKNYVDPIYQAYESRINNEVLEQNQEISDFKTIVNSSLNGFDTRLSAVASGSPLVASSTSGMTNTNRVYVNTTDGKWYYYDGDSWEIGGTYQSSELADESVTIPKLGDDVKFNLNSRINNIQDLNEKGQVIISLANNLINRGIRNNGTVDTLENLKRITTENMIYLPKDTTLKILKNTDRYNVDIYYYDKDFSYLSHTNIRDSFIIGNNNASYFRLIFAKNDNTQNISADDVTTNFEITYKPLNNYEPFIVGTNLFNKNDTVSGYVTNINTIISADTYKTVNLIKLEANTSYVISRFRKFALYDKDLQIITDSFVDSNTTNYTFTTTDECFCTFSVLTSYIDEVMMNKGETPAAFETYRRYLPSDVVASGIDSHDDNILYGKKLVTCGDSFTQYTNATFADGRFSGEMKTYPYLIALRNNMEIQQLAVSGSTITNVSGDQMKFSVSTYQQIDNDADYILIKYGINDEHLHAPLGTINDTNNTTFYGAWNVVMSYIIEHHPTAKIGIIITNGLSIRTNEPNNNNLANATMEIAKKYGVPYLNEWNDPQVPLLLRTGRTDVDESIRNIRRDTFKISADNQHENYICQEYESTFVEDFLKRL